MSGPGITVIRELLITESLVPRLKSNLQSVSRNWIYLHPRALCHRLSAAATLATLTSLASHKMKYLTHSLWRADPARLTASEQNNAHRVGISSPGLR